MLLKLLTSVVYGWWQPYIMVCGYASLPNSEASGSHAGSLKMAMARVGTGKCSAQAVFIPTEPVDQRATMPTHPCENSHSLV